MSATRNIGILTSGGDAPGMNAVIRAFVRRATSNNTNNNMKVFGFNRGYIGLRTGDITEMTVRSVSDILHRGGTVLRTSRDPEFKTQAGLEMAVKTCEKYNIDTVVIIGGNGSLYGARDLSNMGINCIFVPATIDNDIGYTDYSIGFGTALNTGVTMIDKLRDTASSHEKCNLVEVMGKKCGNLALHIGIATGATSILVPEKSYDFQKDIINRTFYNNNSRRLRKYNRNFKKNRTRYKYSYKMYNSWACSTWRFAECTRQNYSQHYGLSRCRAFD